MRVLIADDSQIMRKIIRLNLSKLGVQKVFEAADGHNAYNIAMASRVHLVFTDLNMPLLNGLELVKKMRTSPRLANIKTIVISEFLSPENRESFEKLGVIDFVPKPFDLARFNEVVIPIVEELKNKPDEDVIQLNDQCAFSVGEFIHLVRDEEPKLEIDKDRLVLSFQSAKLSVKIDDLLKSAEFERSGTTDKQLKELGEEKQE